MCFACYFEDMALILKIEKDNIANISASPIERAGIFVKMSVEALRTEVIVFYLCRHMCFSSD